MDILDQLNAWLDQPAYETGVLLYERHIGTGFVLSMLKGGPDDYNRRTLIDALTEKRDTLTTERQARQDSYPVALTDQVDGGKLLMDERTILKERMRMQLNGGINQSEDLKAWAYRILTIRDELAVIYGRKGFFDRHGYMPDQASVDAQQTPAELLKRLMTLRTYETRYTKLLRGFISDEQQQTYTRKLEQYRTELHQVQQQFNALTETTNHVAIPD